MLKATLLAHWGGVSKTARAMGISPTAVRLWGDLIPPEMAIRAVCRSNGELVLDPFMYADWPVRGRVVNPENDRRFARRAA